MIRKSTELFLGFYTK